LRIAITGAHGTGKSTLGRRIANEFDLVELRTPGRLLAERGHPVNLEATVASQTLAWLLQLQLEASARRWVANRTLLDVWAYAALAGERSETTALEKELLNQLERTTRSIWNGRYDVLFYTPPRIPLAADDVRSADPEFQAATDAKIRVGLRRWRLSYVPIDVSSPDAVRDAIEVVRRAGA